LLSSVILAQLTLEPVSAEEFVRASAAAGFEEVGVRLIASAPLGSSSQASPSPLPAGPIKQALKDTGISVHYGMSYWLVPETKTESFPGGLDVCAELGAKYFQIIVNDPEKSRALDNFAKTCELGAERGLDIAIEFLPYSTMRTIGQAAEFISASGQKNAGIVLDALHLSRSGGSPADLKAIDPDLIYCVQLCDAPRTLPAPDQLRVEARMARLYPGEGELWLHEMLDALPADVTLDLEAPRVADAQLSPADKAKSAMQATRRFLDGYVRGKATQARN
jgi:sugar phosphate isomerase/epimerase